MTSHYQWDINTQTKHAPPRLGAPVFASRFARLLRRGRPLRYGPRHYMPPLRGSHLFLWPFPGVPPLAGLHRRALLKFSGILLLFDVQSSTTEKEQKDSYRLFLRRGGARTPGWDYTRKIVRDPSLPVFQRLRVLSRIVDRNISILRTSEIENETELQYHNSV